jgi:hypothetical protein
MYSVLVARHVIRFPFLVLPCVAAAIAMLVAIDRAKGCRIVPLATGDSSLGKSLKQTLKS